MSPRSASGSVKGGQALATLLLVLAIGFGALTLASIGVGVARQGESLLYGDTLSVPLELSADEVGPLPPGVRTTASPEVALEVDDPTTKQMFLRSAPDLGPVVLFVLGLWLMRSFLGTVVAGDPFGTANVKRLRWIGCLLVVGAPVVELLNSVLHGALLNDLPPAQTSDLLTSGFRLPTGAMIGGLGAFILAEVFAYGVQLREDVEGTV